MRPHGKTGMRPHRAVNMRPRRAGFTLIEILVAISLLVLVTGIVYSSFASVMNVTEQARTGNEELRLRQFLARSFSTNLSCVFADGTQQDGRFQFLGIGGKSLRAKEGVSLDFCSSAPLLGAMAPPGMLKVVHYGVRTTEQKTLGGEGTQTSTTLEANETLLVMPVSDLTNSKDTNRKSTSASSGKSMALEGQASPSWTVPIEAMDVAYYDGKEWMEDWDSLAMGRMPWGVRVRINFARSEKEQEENPRTMEDGADFEIVVPVPLGAGVMTDAATWANNASLSAFQDLGGGGGGGGSGGGSGGGGGGGSGGSGGSGGAGGGGRGGSSLDASGRRMSVRQGL